MHSRNHRIAAYQDLAAFTRQPLPPRSVKFKWRPAVDPGPKRFEKTHVTVVSGDTLDITHELAGRGLRPLTLNMASAYTPGGGWSKGAGAQEESLFYRSVYYQTLTRDFYPLTGPVAVYSPAVTVFRNGNLRSCSPWTANFVAVAAVRNPRLVNGQMSPDDLDLTRKKLELIFQIGIEHGHDSLVLSAFGCGAYYNPPDTIIRLFNELIRQYRGYYREIIFAIISASETQKRYHGNAALFDNYTLFSKGIESAE